MRKYEYETGRFISIDPLWSKYYGWTPYQYSMNSPVMLVDFNGFKPSNYEATAMLMHNYGMLNASSLPGGWKPLTPISGNEGFNAGLYSRTVDGITEYSLAFQGTTGSLVGDSWKNNALQIFGESLHYSQSITATEMVRDMIGNAELTALGHSKGGGQAALVSNKFSINAITYNAAGVSSLTTLFNRARGDFSKVEANVMMFDPLSIMQNIIPFDFAPNTDGNVNYIFSFFDGHGIINFYNYYKPKPKIDENTRIH